MTVLFGWSPKAIPASNSTFGRGWPVSLVSDRGSLFLLKNSSFNLASSSGVSRTTVATARLSFERLGAPLTTLALTGTRKVTSRHRSDVAGDPLKPGFGLSGAVLDKMWGQTGRSPISVILL